MGDEDTPARGSVEVGLRLQRLCGNQDLPGRRVRRSWAIVRSLRFRSDTMSGAEMQSMALDHLHVLAACEGHHDTSPKVNFDAIIEAFHYAIHAAYRTVDCRKTVGLAASSVRQRWISASSASGRSISIARWPSEISPLLPLRESQSPS
jgi:hypothetical protein